MAVIIVPKIIVSVDRHRPLIFLAGPIRGGGDWQAKMARELIRQNPEVQIACPSRWNAEHPLRRYFVHPFSPAEHRQLRWERYYMEMAALYENHKGCLLFWLGLEDHKNPHPGPEPYAMDTRREIGKFTGIKRERKLNGQEVRMVVGGSEKFYGLSVIRDELDDAERGPFLFDTNMRSLASEALRIALR